MQSLALVSATEDWGRLGSALKTRREQLRLTQQDVAKRAQISVQTVKTLESGRTHGRYPGALTLVAMALGWRADSPRAILAGGEPELVEEAARDGRTTEQWLRDASDLSPNEVEAMLSVLRVLRERHEEGNGNTRRRA